MAGITLRPLHLGTQRGDKSVQVYLRHMGEMVDLPTFAWFIDGAEAKILVDTGAPPPSELSFTVAGYEQPPEQQIGRSLARLAISPADIEIVVLTHLHWDHCLNAGLFPRARFIVQRAELRCAAAPLPIHRRQYGRFAPGTHALLPDGGNVDVIEGDRAVVKGVSVALLPGHTPGIQGVVVDTQAGTYLIAGDNVPLYDNWHGEPPGIQHIPSSLHVDLEAYYSSLARMECLADYILPGHDVRLLDSPAYPPGTAGQ
ncbi:MAG: N-acyl homoserine lactonase family protein [Dehalococcoidales bacterium]|nr:N-acyl homoserine lactonase family protein [Dehalococcoidales bacterium]